MSPPSRSFFASPRGAVTAVFFAFGAVVGLWAGSIPAIMRGAGISSFELGIGITIYTIAYVLTMYFGGAFARFAGNRTILLAATPLIALSAASLLIAASPLLFFASLILLGAVLGLTDLFMNAEASYVESDLKKPVFTAFHASGLARRRDLRHHRKRCHRRCGNARHGADRDCIDRRRVGLPSGAISRRATSPSPRPAKRDPCAGRCRSSCWVLQPGW